jgi:hypothetical protein
MEGQEAAMKILFPIALMTMWAVMVALTVADFAGFYQAVHAAEAPNIQAVEVIHVISKRPKARTASDCVAHPGLQTAQAAHD